MPEKTFPTQTILPTQIRVSLGTAIVLELLEGKLDSEPTTAYLMTYKTGKCNANCSFCSQARTSKSNTEFLSRVAWPTFPTPNALTALAKGAKLGKIRRVCIQALNYSDVFLQLSVLVQEIKKWSAIPVSVSCQPLNIKNIELMKQSGVDRLGIALDASTKALFNKVKGPGTGSFYSWENQFTQMINAVRVFGKGNVSTHVIFGLGETEVEAAEVIQRCVDMTVLPGLFAFTPIRGTALEGKSPPKLDSYRRVQLARYLIVNGKARSEEMQSNYEGEIISFGVSNEVLEKMVDSGLPFRTSGCPDCNRPFYNEKPSGPIYNYSKQPCQEEIEKIKKQLW